MPGWVCTRCHGRGFVYLGHGKTRACPACGGNSTAARKAAAQHSAIDALRTCWRRYRQGEVGIDNVELAIAGALNHANAETLHRQTGVPLPVLKAGVRGQQGLF